MKAIHIGFPKTATTFLQTTVFPRLTGRGFAYVPRGASTRLFAPLIDDDDTIFDPDAMADRVREHASDAPNALFSYEALTGEHFRSGFVNRTQIARRLRREGFERVLITIRNQFDVLESAYRQHVQSGGVLRFRDYASLDPGKPMYLHTRYFDYDLTYDLYATIFGAGLGPSIREAFRALVPRGPYRFPGNEADSDRAAPGGQQITFVREDGRPSGPQSLHLQFVQAVEPAGQEVLHGNLPSRVARAAVRQQRPLLPDRGRSGIDRSDVRGLQPEARGGGRNQARTGLSLISGATAVRTGIPGGRGGRRGAARKPSQRSA